MMQDFEGWFSELKAIFDKMGGAWDGYADEMRRADEGALKEAFEGGVSPKEIADSEFDAAH